MESTNSLLSLQGHALFVWGAWMPCLLGLVAEAFMVGARLRRARTDAARRNEEAPE